MPPIKISNKENEDGTGREVPFGTYIETVKEAMKEVIIDMRK